MSTRERWLPIPGFVGLYEVSDQGRVRTLETYHRSRTGRVLSLRTNPRDNYQQIRLTRPDRSRICLQVHRLVLLAFIGPRPAGMGARHLNGDPKDNRLENLAWGTQSENNYDQVKHGTHAYAARSHCKQGHEFTPDNTVYFPSRRGRCCKACRSEYARRVKAKQLQQLDVAA